jgi:hypothetical protein
MNKSKGGIRSMTAWSWQASRILMMRSSTLEAGPAVFAWMSVFILKAWRIPWAGSTRYHECPSLFVLSWKNLFVWSCVEINQLCSVEGGYFTWQNDFWVASLKFRPALLTSYFCGVNNPCSTLQSWFELMSPIDNSPNIVIST